MLFHPAESCKKVYVKRTLFFNIGPMDDTVWHRSQASFKQKPRQLLAARRYTIATYYKKKNYTARKKVLIFSMDPSE